MTDFYRIRRLPPYVFAEVNAMKAAARARECLLPTKYRQPGLGDGLG